MKPALLQTLLVLAAANVSAGASAQAASGEPAYPIKPIRVVVPFTPGSATDIIARVIGPKLVERWGRPVVIDNRPSAGGIVAGSIAAEATPDGHTLMAIGSAFAGSAALYSKLPYDSVRDFSGITQNQGADSKPGRRSQVEHSRSIRQAHPRRNCDAEQGLEDCRGQT